MTISDFVRKMNNINSKYFDLQQMLHRGYQIKYLNERQNMLALEVFKDRNAGENVESPETFKGPIAEILQKAKTLKIRRLQKKKSRKAEST